MLIKISLHNIRQKKFRTFLSSLSIAIGTASVIILLGLSNGIQNATFTELEKTSPLTEITVKPKTTNNKILSFIPKDTNIKSEDVEKIEAIKNVKTVAKETQFNNFSSIEGEIFGISIITDSMVFGLPKKYVKEDIKNENEWGKETKPYPVILPKKLLDIYNLSIAGPKGLPQISGNQLIGKQFTLYPNKSTFFPSSGKTEKINVKVVGVSDKVNLIGITTSDKIVEELNKKYSKKKTTILSLHVETTSEKNTEKVAKEIESLGYDTRYFQKNVKSIESKFTYLKIAMGTISLIILLTATIAILSTFLATIAERTKELGLFRALGATKKQIRKIILYEAGIVGIIGSAIGITAGILTSSAINKFSLKELEKITLRPESLFKIDAKLILTTLIFGITLSLIAAYFPAKNASKISPIDALK